MVGDCIFCKIVKGVLNGHDSGEPDIPGDRVFESDDFIVIRDINPQVEGHLLVVSKEHYEDFMSLPEGLYGKMLGVVKKVVLQEGIKDFNLVVNNGKVAGQIISHFHLHILPRVEGDGFRIG